MTLYHNIWSILLYCTKLIVAVWNILAFVKPQLRITRVEMGLDPASLRLDQQLLQFMDQLEILEEKRQKLNTLIEEVRHCNCDRLYFSWIHRVSLIWCLVPVLNQGNLSFHRDGLTFPRHVTRWGTSMFPPCSMPVTWSHLYMFMKGT